MTKKKKITKKEVPVYEKGFEPISRKGGGFNYRTQVRINGKTYRKIFSTIKLARVWKNHMLATREENRANGIPYLNSLYFEDVCDEFLRTRVGTKASTKKSYSSTIKTHLIEPFGRIPIKDIKKTHAIKLQGIMEANKHSPGGINKVVALFSSILDFAVRMEYLEKNLLRGVRRLKVDARFYKYWTQDEIKKFLSNKEVKNSELYHVFLFALNSGLRRGEICGLLWKNVLLDKGQISFNEQLTPDMERQLVKGHVLRTVSLSPGALDILKGLYNNNDSEEYVFRLESGGPVPPNRLTAEWRNVQKRAGMKNIINFHGARHSFASFLVSSGVSLKYVQQLLGHKDSKVTERYSHLNTEDEKKAVQIVNFGI